MTTELKALLGRAGSGKSFYINSLLKQDKTFGLRTASTGIAALNMESIYNVDEPTTINSALRFFNTEDLLRSYHLGKTSFALKPIANKYKNIILDEVGMINAGTLDLIVLALDKFNAASPKKLGLLICGDVGQLEPVEGSPCFMANCWPRFNIEYLTEVKRQDNYEFVEALSLVREGNIKEALPWFKDNINFIDQPNYSFRGTTFFALNDEVNYFNKICLDKLQGKSKTYKAELKGVAHPTWSSIPQTLTLKPGSIIQILYNNLDYGFANGDSAIVQDLWEKSIYISLLRKNKDFFLKPRELLHYTFNNKGYTEKKPIGKLTVLHCKLMYAASAHKGQGLSLDNVQINLKGRGQSFFGRQSGMLYTALSRVRTPEGLTLIGTPEDLIKCCYVNPLYKPWIK